MNVKAAEEADLPIIIIIITADIHPAAVPDQ